MSALLPPLSLRILLAAAFGLVALVCATGFSLFLERNVARAWKAEIRSDLGHAAAGLREALDGTLAERWGDLRLAAGLDAIRGESASSQDRRHVLHALKEARGAFAWIGFIDAQGRLAGATGGPPEGEEAGAHPWFGEALTGPVLAEAHEPRHLAGAPARALDLAVPVRDAEGRAVGALAARLGLDFAREAVRAAAARVPGAVPDLLVLARDGTMLVGPKALEGRPLVGSDALAAGSGQDAPVWSDGRAYLAAVAAAPALAGRGTSGLGWSVVARVDAQAALAPLAALRLRLLLWGGALAGLLAALGALLSSRVSRPLRALRRAAQRMREDHDPGPLPSVDGYREAGQMSRALGALLADRRASASASEDALARAESALARLRISEERLRLALKAGRFGGWELTLSTRALKPSRAFKRIFGRGGAQPFTYADLLLAIHPEDRGQVRGALDEAVRTRSAYAAEHRILRADGQTRWVDMRAGINEGEGGAPARLVGVAADITARKRAEEALRATKERLSGTLTALEEVLHQKELLLKETDHRIKNSLQIVASLLALQGGRIADPEARRAFALAAERVRTVGEVHRRLYEGPSPGQVDAGALVRGLCADLQGSGLFAECPLEVEAGEVELAHDRVVPLGLILNELLTNAAKHGCPRDRPGLVRVTFEAAGEEELRLSVTDNGDGLSEAALRAGTGGLGMRLVRALAGQLRGRLEVGAGPEGRGAAFTVTFPRHPTQVVLEEAAPEARVVALARAGAAEAGQTRGVPRCHAPDHGLPHPRPPRYINRKPQGRDGDAR